VWGGEKHHYGDLNCSHSVYSPFSTTVFIIRIKLYYNDGFRVRKLRLRKRVVLSKLSGHDNDNSKLAQSPPCYSTRCLVHLFYNTSQNFNIFMELLFI
jgi:hypothetical protein